MKIITPTTTEPVTLAEMKLFLRVDHTEEDALIQALITAAREHIETFTRRSIVTQTYEIALDQFQKEIRIPLPPLKTVDSITYKDINETITTLSDFITDNENEPARVILSDIPNVELYPINAVRIRFTTGYEAIPEVFKQSLKLLVSHFYENREITTTQSVNKIPFTIESLLYPYRVGWF